MASLITVQYHYGWGRHYIYIPPAAAVYAVKYNVICQSFSRAVLFPLASLTHI
jgi:hypothetical protein